MPTSLSYYGVSDFCFSNFKAFLALQQPDGFIPRSFGTKPFGRNQHFKPFLAQIAVLGSQQKGGSYEWLRASYYEGLKKYLDRWFAYDGDKNGLPVWDSSDASGMDNQLSRAGRQGSYFCEGTDLACYLYRELECMAFIAGELGKSADKADFQARAVALAKTINDVLWDERDGFYYDRNEKTGQPIRVKSVAGFIPLWAGIAPPEKAKRLVQEHLTNPKEFWLKYPVASYAATEADYFQGTRGGCNWRGTSWVSANYMIMHGLLRYGFKDVARNLAYRNLEMALERNPTTREYYNADTGSGNGMDPFWGWSSLAYVMPLDVETGYDPTELVPHIRPLLAHDLGVVGPDKIVGDAATLPSPGLKAQDRHATVSFSGGMSAKLYSKEVAESLSGVLTYNYVGEDSTYPVGFVRASPDPQPWHKTFWTRDGGTFLRELVKWGYTEQARRVASCMMQLVGKNHEGYYAFPRYFESRIPRSGEELDGTSAIIIGMTMLERSLPPQNTVKAEIYRFLHADSSPVKFIEYRLKNRPLLSGEGEFGGGMKVNGPYYNVVQNQLSALALRAYADMEEDAGDKAAAQEAWTNADQLSSNILKYLVGKDGAWIWCIDPKTMKSDDAILNSVTNQGFGGINGVLSMYADVSGLEPARTDKELYAVSLQTFQKLYNTPARKRQFDTYGIWTQFDRVMGGAGASPSYGMGYATQDMLLFDNLTMASKALEFLAQDTFHPVDGYALHRQSPYYFYERMYSPEAIGKVEMAEGCGALNLVNVAEPLKLARVMIGIDDSDPATLRLIPRVPSEWNGFEAKDWPVLTRHGTVTINLSYKREADGVHFHFESAETIKSVVVRLPAGNGWKYYNKADTDHFDLTQPN